VWKEFTDGELPVGTGSDGVKILLITSTDTFCPPIQSDDILRVLLVLVFLARWISEGFNSHRCESVSTCPERFRDPWLEKEIP